MIKIQHTSEPFNGPVPGLTKPVLHRFTTESGGLTHLSTVVVNDGVSLTSDTYRAVRRGLQKSVERHTK